MKELKAWFLRSKTSCCTDRMREYDNSQLMSSERFVYTVRTFC